MNSKNLLIIFTRNPILGKVKTRLAKSVGNETALEIYQFLLDKTKKIVEELSCKKAVFYSEEIAQNDIWDTDSFEKHVQIGSDLGDKMQNAFQRSFEKGYDKILIIGSDLYDLQASYIDESFESLDTNDVVIGPALDGGYYLLGLKKATSKIFKNKDWGSSSVRKDTLKDLEEVDVHLLPMLNDVDVLEDIENHPAFTKFLKNS